MKSTIKDVKYPILIAILLLLFMHFFIYWEEIFFKGNLFLDYV